MRTSVHEQRVRSVTCAHPSMSRECVLPHETNVKLEELKIESKFKRSLATVHPHITTGPLTESAFISSFESCIKVDGHILFNHSQHTMSNVTRPLPSCCVCLSCKTMDVTGACAHCIPLFVCGAWMQCNCSPLVCSQ